MQSFLAAVHHSYLFFSGRHQWHLPWTQVQSQSLQDILTPTLQRGTSSLFHFLQSPGTLIKTLHLSSLPSAVSIASTSQSSMSICSFPVHWSRGTRVSPFHRAIGCLKSAFSVPVSFLRCFSLPLDFQYLIFSPWFSLQALTDPLLRHSERLPLNTSSLNHVPLFFP